MKKILGIFGAVSFAFFSFTPVTAMSENESVTKEKLDPNLINKKNLNSSYNGYGYKISLDDKVSKYQEVPREKTYNWDLYTSVHSIDLKNYMLDINKEMSSSSITIDCSGSRINGDYELKFIAEK